jgi:hypothetical protein
MEHAGRAGWAGLVLAGLLGLFLRARGLDFALPHYTPSDELVMVDQLDNLRRGRPQTALDGTVAPSYPLLGAYLAEPVRLHPAGTGPADLPSHVARASALRLDLRAATALISLLAVPATWLLARRFLSPGAASLAALFVALDALSISSAQMGRPHGPVSTFSLLGVLAAMRLARTGKGRDYLLAGAALVLALGCLHSGAALLAPLAAAHLLARRRSGGAGPARWAWLVATLALAALAVRLFYPFHFEEWTTAEARQDANELNISGHRLWWSDFDGSGWLALLGTFYSYDPVLLVLLFGGLVALFGARRSFAAQSELARADLLVALAYAVPYAALLVIYARTAERFVLPLVPFAATAAAFGAERAARALALPARARLLAAAVLLAGPLAGAVGLSSVRASPDTPTLAARWIEQQLDPATARVFLIPYHTLPLFYGPESLRSNWEESRKSEWLEYLVAQDPADLLGPRFEVFHPARRDAGEEIGPDPMAWLRGRGFTHVLVQHVRGTFGEDLLVTMRRALERQAELLARFHPMRSDDGQPARVDYNYSRNVLARPFVWHLLMAERMGPTLELYRLR